MSQGPSASLLFSKSFDKVKDLLPGEFDQSGSVPLDDGFDDGDDWSLPPVFDDDQVEETAAFRQRGLCANELDVTASVTDLDWSVIDRVK